MRTISHRLVDWLRRSPESRGRAGEGYASDESVVIVRVVDRALGIRGRNRQRLRLVGIEARPQWFVGSGSSNRRSPLLRRPLHLRRLWSRLGGGTASLVVVVLRQVVIVFQQPAVEEAPVAAPLRP